MRRLVARLLLLALFFNTAHAFFVDHRHDGAPETVQTFVAEMEHGGECGDVCDAHHMFHFSAVPAAAVVTVALCGRIAPETRTPDFFALFHPEPTYRPPIR